jgi:hypothetical protein
MGRAASMNTRATKEAAMPDSTFLELHDHVGVTADDNLEPLVEIGVTLAVPTMIKDPDTGKDELAEAVTSLTISSQASLGDLQARVLPGTRIIETADQRVTQALLGTGHWQQIDAPTKTAAAAAAKALKDAAEEAGTHAQDPDNPTEG